MFIRLLFLRRKKDGNVTFDTVCHNPAEKLYGLILKDYNNSECEMKELSGMGSKFFICSCSEDECNERVFFDPSKLNWQFVKMYEINVVEDSSLLIFNLFLLYLNLLLLNAKLCATNSCKFVSLATLVHKSMQ